MANKISQPIIYWLLRDLRIDDNQALSEALKRKEPILPVFIWSPDEESPWDLGAASRWWMHHSLDSHIKSLEKLGLKLVIKKGDSQKVLESLIKETGAKSIFWNRRYEPRLIKRDKSIEKKLIQDGVEVKTFNSHLLAEPWEIKNGSGEPYKVFTPFWKKLKSEIKILPTKNVNIKPIPISKYPKSLKLSELELLPKIPWDDGLKKTWTPGEESAKRTLKLYLKDAALKYAEERNRPDIKGTSRLSPYLRFGEISVRKVYLSLEEMSFKTKGVQKHIEVYQSELGWREFAYHILYHFPHTLSKPLKPQFEKLGCQSNSKYLKLWSKGMTGYPIVDAGIRELWSTGWMHNRVRMIVASFLTKDLFVPWQDGAKWFWDTLVDADLASNTLGWQWTAGCGADAAPYFRIFNPILQGEKFDPEGKYIKKWIPELKDIPTKYIHKPWEVPKDSLFDRGKTNSYPDPMIDHFSAKKYALDCYNKTKESS